jgi:hypothetical protein
MTRRRKTQEIVEAVLWNMMQVAGAPGFVFLSWWLYAAISRRLAREAR